MTDPTWSESHRDVLLFWERSSPEAIQLAIDAALSELSRRQQEIDQLKSEAATCRCPDQSYADQKIAEQQQEIDQLRSEKRNHDESGENCGWHSLAREMSNNTEFYRGLIVRCGEAFGVEARTSDDGSVQDSVLALKVPELVERQAQEIARLKWTIRNIRLCAAMGRSFGHNATPQTPEKMVERKDFRLDRVLKYCADAGETGSILRSDEGAAVTNKPYLDRLAELQQEIDQWKQKCIEYAETRDQSERIRYEREEEIDTLKAQLERTKACWVICHTQEQEIARLRQAQTVIENWISRWEASPSDHGTETDPWTYAAQELRERLNALPAPPKEDA